MRRLASLLAVSAFVSALWAQEASSTLQFKFTEKQRELFDATVELNGNLPIPGAAGMAGTLKMMMTVFMEVDKVEDGGKATVKTGLEAFDAEFNGQPFPVGLDMARNFIPDSTRLQVFEWGVWGDWQTLAQRLFLGLRTLEAAGVHAIVCPLPPDEGLARALRDRLQRAAHD